MKLLKSAFLAAMITQVCACSNTLHFEIEESTVYNPLSRIHQAMATAPEDIFPELSQLKTQGELEYAKFQGALFVYSVCFESTTFVKVSSGICQ